MYEKFSHESLKIPYLLYNGEGSGKVIRNPYPGPDHHQKSVSHS